MGRLTGVKKQTFKIVTTNLKMGLAEKFEDYVGEINKECKHGEGNNNAVLRELVRIAVDDPEIKAKVIRAIDIKAMY